MTAHSRSCAPENDADAEAANQATEPPQGRPRGKFFYTLAESCPGPPIASDAPLIARGVRPQRQGRGSCTGRAALAAELRRAGPIAIFAAKALGGAGALLWAFHNARSGLCFPSYETIAEAAHCARSTVAEAVEALEDAGVLGSGPADQACEGALPRPVRRRRRNARGAAADLSNAYRFNDPGGVNLAVSNFGSAFTQLLSPKSRREHQTKITFLR